jgi:hypothetical protein
MALLNSGVEIVCLIKAFTCNCMTVLPNAGWTDDLETFFSLTRRYVGSVFSLKQFKELWPKIVRLANDENIQVKFLIHYRLVSLKVKHTEYLVKDLTCFETLCLLKVRK